LLPSSVTSPLIPHSVAAMCAASSTETFGRTSSRPAKKSKTVTAAPPVQHRRSGDRARCHSHMTCPPRSNRENGRMALPTEDTIVSYPVGSTSGTGRVLHVEALGDDRSAVVLDATPCHPVDAAWPDQGPDRAGLAWGGAEADVVDCVVAATDGATLHLGDDIPVRKGTEGWSFLVAHLIDGEAPEVGDEVTVTVDAVHRRALSIGHTACHLASL